MYAGDIRQHASVIASHDADTDDTDLRAGRPLPR